MRGLIRRLLLSFLVAVAGLWGLLVTRLSSPFFNTPVLRNPGRQPFFDTASAALFILGILLLIYYRRLLGSKVRTLEELGVDKW